MTFFTSLLPVSVGQTSFPIKAPAWNPARSQAPHPVAASDSPSAEWSLLDGPPYANGSLHLGHVRNKLLKDTMARSAHADGASVSWRAGWDCHGLPVERNVEALGFSRNEPRLFLQASRDYAMGQTLAQKAQFESLELSCDMDNAYRTMDFTQQANTLRVFARMVEQGSVYRAYRPVRWCHECESTVANAESELLPLTTSDLYFFVSLSDGKHAMVWTTQAWSLYAHDALVVNPAAEYGLYRLTRNEQSRDVWLSCEAADNVRTLDVYAVESLGSVVQGSALVGMTYNLPWTQRPHSVLGHLSVQSGAGTGWLHASAACSEDDDAMLADAGAASPSLSMGLMATNGSLAVAGGAMYWVAHGSVCKDELERDSFSHVVRVRREKEHCWRHKVGLTVRPSAQWYVRLDAAVKQRALDRAEQVKFVPSNGKTRLLDAVMQRPDWCVSRQRTWGVPLGLYANEKGDVAPFAVSAMREFADSMEVQGSVALYDAARERDGYQLCTDVLDVWFDSGACFLTTTNKTPDLVVEGHDQYRGWFQSSLLVSAVLDERLPYKQVVAHGFVLAKAGEKLSKSADNAKKGKATAPAWETVHPDVLRVWTNQGEVANDKFWNAESFDNATALYQKWRNTLRFLLANLPVQAPCPGAEKEWTNAEKWTVYMSRVARTRVVQSLRAGNTDMAVEAMHTWCQTLSNHSFMMVKDRLYCGNQNERESVHALLREVLVEFSACAQCLMPSTWSEAQGYLPDWFTSTLVDVNTPLSTSVKVEVDDAWSAWFDLREKVAVLWSAHSVKGKGGLVWGNVGLTQAPSGLSPKDALQWLGTSSFVQSDQPALWVEVMDDGTLCDRCRMVSVGVCRFCETRAVAKN